MGKYMLGILLVFFCSCGQNAGSKANEEKDTTIISNEFEKEALKMFPESAEVDSLVILYYRDKERFRYYTFHATNKKGTVKALYDNLERVTVSPDTCTKDGTIYCYIKGNIYNSVYFNITPPCAYISMIHNGRLHRYKMSEALKADLQDLKLKAVEPKSTGNKAN